MRKGNGSWRNLKRVIPSRAGSTDRTSSQKGNQQQTYARRSKPGWPEDDDDAAI